MEDAIAAMQAYRARLIKAGRLIEARSVEHCIGLLRSSGNKLDKPAQTADSAHCTHSQ